MFVFHVLLQTKTSRKNHTAKATSNLHFNVFSFHMSSNIRLSLTSVSTVSALPKFVNRFIYSWCHFISDNAIKV